MQRQTARDSVDIFRRLANLLKARHPKLTISVRRVPMGEGWHGLCRRAGNNKTTFQIKVQSRDSWQMQLDTLVHEIAHAATYEEWERLNDHGPLWGQEYAECYKIYERVLSQ